MATAFLDTINDASRRVCSVFFFSFHFGLWITFYLEASVVSIFDSIYLRYGTTAVSILQGGGDGGGTERKRDRGNPKTPDDGFRKFITEPPEVTRFGDLSV